MIGQRVEVDGKTIEACSSRNSERGGEKFILSAREMISLSLSLSLFDIADHARNHAMFPAGKQQMGGASPTGYYSEGINISYTSDGILPYNTHTHFQHGMVETHSETIFYMLMSIKNKSIISDWSE